MADDRLKTIGISTNKTLTPMLTNDPPSPYQRRNRQPNWWLIITAAAISIVLVRVFMELSR